MKLRYTLFIIPILLFSSCTKENCFGEAGNEVAVTRAATAFHQIDVFDNIDVVLTQDTLERVTVIAPQHLEPNISTRVEDGVLTLKNEAICTGLRKASEKVKVHVHLKQLDKVVYAGSGNITSTNTLMADNIHFYSGEGAGNIDVTLNAAQTLSYIMDENADFTFHGKSDVCWSYTASRGSIDFSDFTVKKMIIEYGGVRDAAIHVTEDLNSIIYHKGNVYYKGAPQITRDEVHSSGRLIRSF
jgi:hypothetical protein